MAKNNLLKGTFILTIAGLITRVLGFFYKIYLSRILTTETLGVYQLIFPVYGLCFTLYASGIQTALSTLVAAHYGKKSNTINVKGGQTKEAASVKSILQIGFLSSLSIALVCSNIVYYFSDFIACNLIHEEACKGSLEILAYVFPFCSVTSCINGYYYGRKKAAVPAVTQLLEQIARILFVCIFAISFGKNNIELTCEIAVWGIVAGEVVSCLFNLLSLVLSLRVEKKNISAHGNKENSFFFLFRELMKLATPLTANRFFINLLHSVEAVLIPYMLKYYGLSNESALSIYGILTGMSMAFISFPSTVTNSLSVLLLPSISEAKSKNDYQYIQNATETSIKYTLLVGTFSTGIFLIYGSHMGNLFFGSRLAGDFLMVLSWLCPFLYLTTTFGSIINGLGNTYTTFFNSTIGLGIRIVFICLLIPNGGIKGYFIGLLVSQLITTFLDYHSLQKDIKFHMNAVKWICIPFLFTFILGKIGSRAYNLILPDISFSPVYLLFFICCVVLLLYLVLLKCTGIISKNDLFGK